MSGRALQANSGFEHAIHASDPAASFIKVDDLASSHLFQR